MSFSSSPGLYVRRGVTLEPLRAEFLPLARLPPLEALQTPSASSSKIIFNQGLTEKEFYSVRDIISIGGVNALSIDHRVYQIGKRFLFAPWQHLPGMPIAEHLIGSVNSKKGIEPYEGSLNACIGRWILGKLVAHSSLSKEAICLPGIAFVEISSPRFCVPGVPVISVRKCGILSRIEEDYLPSSSLTEEQLGSMPVDTLHVLAIFDMLTVNRGRTADNLLCRLDENGNIDSVLLLQYEDLLPRSGEGVCAFPWIENKTLQEKL